MARLSASERAKLPDSAFAYVDSRGQRRLPINDEPHVRNALSRFGQVRFETEKARETARRKLLHAAKRHGILPVGFIDGELRSAGRRSDAGRLIIELGRIETSAELEAELRRTLNDPTLSLLRWSKPEGTYIDCDAEPTALPAASSEQHTTFLQGRGRPLMAIVHDRSVLQAPEITEAVMAAVHLVAGKELLDEIDELGIATDGLPDGEVTFLLTDIEGSTLLLRALGERYAGILADVRTIIREAVLQAGGRQVEARADEFVAVFEGSAEAVDAAVAMQQSMAERAWPDGHQVRVRVGLHTGDIILTETGYVGITVHTAARIMSAAHGGQVLVSGTTRAAAAASASARLFRSLGTHRLRGLADEHELLQVEATGLGSEFPPPAV
jgi:class 3 adenylate cyclase